MNSAFVILLGFALPWGARGIHGVKFPFRQNAQRHQFKKTGI
jgi:hypothetical protein